MAVKVEQDQTKFDDLGKDFQRTKWDWKDFKNNWVVLSNFAFLPSLTFKMTFQFKFDFIRQHNLGVPEIFNFKIFSAWAFLGP